MLQAGVAAIAADLCEPRAAMTAVIRPMQAADVAAVMRLHLIAFAGAESTALGSRYVAAFIEWFLSDDGVIALVAAADHDVCGYVVGLPAERQGILYRHLLSSAVASVLRRPRLAFDASVRAMALQRLQLLMRRRTLVDSPQPTIILHTIGVAVDRQRRGIGGQLVRTFREAALARGARSLILEVLASNGVARRLYEREGWALRGHSNGARLRYALELA